MKNKKLIYSVLGLALLFGLSGFKLTNNIKQLNSSSLGPVQFGSVYSNCLHNNNGNAMYQSSLVDRINYHDNNSGNLHPIGKSAYEFINTGQNENKLTKFHQSSDINITSPLYDVYYLNTILIIELYYNYKLNNNSYEKKLAICIVPHMKKNKNVWGGAGFDDLFSVYVTTNLPYTNNLPSINSHIWSLVLTTTKASPKHARDGNGFNYNSALFKNGEQLSFVIELDDNISTPFIF